MSRKFCDAVAAITAGLLPESLLCAIVLCALTLSLLFLGCDARNRVQPLTNDAYIWQRHWTQPLRIALEQSAPSIRAWRVLVAETEAGSSLTKFAVDRQALRQTKNPVIAVIRIDGRGDITPLSDNLAAASLALISDWKREGVPVLGLEIDYDCPSQRLARYQGFLHLLRLRMPSGLALFITALPSWIGSKDLPELLTQVDESVLQVHSVMSPSKGLFDRTTAYKWAKAWSALSPGPFRLALPTYWSRLSWNPDGRVVSIESEVNRYGIDGVSREMPVEPTRVVALVADLLRAPLRNLKGIAWFRLPIATDQRAWSLPTWRAVMLGRPLLASLPAVSFRDDKHGARDVYLRNQSAVDTALPSRIAISGQGCEFADAIAPYEVDRRSDVVQFLATGGSLLRSGDERLIGWVRCQNRNLEAHVSF